MGMEKHIDKYGLIIALLFAYEIAKDEALLL